MLILTFGKAHRRSWRHKSSANSSGGVIRSSDIDTPGQQVGTDQIVSDQRGIFSQEKVSMKKSLILRATVFEDYATCWVKVHIMQDTSGNSTLEAKEIFERDCMARNVLPKH